MLKVLKQVNCDPKEEKIIEEIIVRYLYYTLFYPIIETNHIPKKSIINNAKNGKSLEEAIKSGDIHYQDGKFQGKFSATISRQLRELGAKFNSKSRTFTITKTNLPSSVQIAIVEESLKNKQRVSRTLNTINSINTNNINDITFIPEYQTILNEMDIKITENVSQFAVSPELTTRMKHNIAEAYSENLKLYIKNFADEEVLKLRQEVEKNMFKGFRREKLVELIKERYGVSQNKAKFLAKQETSLLMASFTKDRYEDSGVKKFEWTRSHSKKPDAFHEKLYGKIFSFDDPPIIDEKTGQRGLPGQRFGCGCGMRAIIEI